MRVLGLIRSFDADRSDPGLLAQINREADTDQLMFIVNFAFSANGRLKVTLAVQEIPKSVLRDGDARGVVGILVGKIGNLQQSRIGETLYCSWEIDNTEIIGWL